MRNRQAYGEKSPGNLSVSRGFLTLFCIIYGKRAANIFKDGLFRPWATLFLVGAAFRLRLFSRGLKTTGYPVSGRRSRTYLSLIY